MTTARTLADSLADVYRYYLSAILDDDTARKWSRDWPAIELGLADVLRRIGRQVWWKDHEPTDESDVTPYVVADLDEATGRVTFGDAHRGECEMPGNVSTRHFTPAFDARHYTAIP